MERDLVLRFKTAREAVASADEALKTAREEERQAEQANEHQRILQDRPAIGYLVVRRPRLHEHLAHQAP